MNLGKNWRPSSPEDQPHHNARFWTIIIILISVALGLIFRLFDLTILKHRFLKQQGDARTIRIIEIPAYRGMILDRNGEPLAISTPMDTVWVNPKECYPSVAELQKLASVLNLSVTDLNNKINQKQKEFIYLKRALDPQTAADVKALNITGIYLQPEFHRFYPEGEVFAHILGFTDIDDQGQEGLELAYNNWLQGVPGLKRVLKDRFGHTVQDLDTIRPTRAGHNLWLSLDRRIQYFAYRELAQGAQNFKAESGSAIVVNVQTGEILAMVNWPSYNPNARPSIHDGRYRNRAVTDVFEPGSTIKAFSMANALASGKYQINSLVNTSPGWMIVAHKKIDDDGHDNGIIDLTTILKVSSNVGISKVTLSLPPENLWNTLHSLGFGDTTDINFPGERTGVLPNYRVWNPFVLATMSFGYGLSVTAVQLAQAYTILASGGLKRPLSLLKIDHPAPAQRILDQKVAQSVLTMLESVLTQGGTAPLAQVPGYRVTGKTGTARMIGPSGYQKGHHNSLFVGIAPASQPKLVVIVVLHDPQGGVYMGGYTAGPIFARIMGEALQILGIPPDTSLTNPAPAVKTSSTQSSEF